MENIQLQPLIKQDKIPTWILRLFYVSIGFLPLYFLHTGLMQILIFKAKNGEDVEQFANHIDTLNIITLFLSIPVGITLAIIFWIWFYRAYKNLARAGIKIDHTPSMTIWGFIIPIVNFFFPGFIMQELAKKMHKNLDKTFEYGKIITLWYVFFVINMLAKRFSAKFPTKTLDDWQTWIFIELFSLIIMSVAVYFSIKMFKNIRETEKEFFEKNSQNPQISA